MITRKIKRVALLSMLAVGSFFIDANGYLPEAPANTSEAGRILGTGVKVEEGPCITWPDGSRTMEVKRTVTFLWMTIGDSWWTTEDC